MFNGEDSGGVIYNPCSPSKRASLVTTMLLLSDISNNAEIQCCKSLHYKCMCVCVCVCVWLAELCSQVSSRDHQQLEQVLPVLQTRLAQATQALTDCLHIRDTAAHW